MEFSDDFVETASHVVFRWEDPITEDDERSKQAMLRLGDQLGEWERGGFRVVACTQGPTLGEADEYRSVEYLFTMVKT
jgi:hypothetical protein